MHGQRVQFDDETWQAIQAVAQRAPIALTQILT